MTAMDIWMLICIIFVVMAKFEYALQLKIHFGRSSRWAGVGTSSPRSLPGCLLTSLPACSLPSLPEGSDARPSGARASVAGGKGARPSAARPSDAGSSHTCASDGWPADAWSSGAENSAARVGTPSPRSGADPGSPLLAHPFGSKGDWVHYRKGGEGYILGGG